MASSSVDAGSAQSWVRPACRPEHIEQLISGVERYNPQSLQPLTEYLGQQLGSGSYDALTNLAILKLYQFNPSEFNFDVTVQILLKALTAVPGSDFNLCISLLGETPVSVLSVRDQGEAAKVPTAGIITEPIIARLSHLGSLLFQTRFREFWSTLASNEYGDVRRYAQQVNGFEDAVRGVALSSVQRTFRTISSARLSGYLNVAPDALPSFLSKYPSWSISENTVQVPANPDNEVKATVVREEMPVENLVKLLSQTRESLPQAS